MPFTNLQRKSKPFTRSPDKYPPNATPSLTLSFSSPASSRANDAVKERRTRRRRKRTPPTLFIWFYLTPAHQEDMETNGKKPQATKNRGPFRMLRVAFYMLRRRSCRKPPMQMQVGEKSAWRRLMCIMRPLQSPPLAPALPIEEHAADDSFHEVTLPFPPSSPDYAPPRVYEDGMSSRYASAEDLKELVEEQNGGDAVVAIDDLSHEEEDGEESGNPHEIDLQAEEFIAKFYEQMRLQRIDSMQRYNRWLEKQHAREEKKAELTPGGHVKDGLCMN